ncbi:MAG: F0F1 ATP synthase subunit gamma [Antarcticimicrobium sp.]|uniref:F0F1 ATP synthase subunit gamma n=1 Tax=Antarcticimicrobium sp. TaxID=2824147 RepID=UPI00262C28D1|nr:F0F1 ATP synthase subunit gamma [Antarcticimicrobium sp.]MDF1715434.1 F0F1 ATP synthase subunit gamma [Antarcticimicrobium sp.]
METLEDLSRHIEVAHDLQSVVRTMKAISAVGIRRHEVAERAMRHYLETVELGLQAALHDAPESGLWPGGEEGGRVGVVLIGSEIGLCGGFNERLVGFALERLAEQGIGTGDRRTMVIGTRAGASWQAEAGAPAHLEEAPATIEALPATVGRVLTLLDRWRSQDGATRLLLFHQRIGGPQISQPVEVPLLPIAPDWLAGLRARRWPSRRLPVRFGPANDVTRALIRQVLLARVIGAVIQSHAAEHAERLSAMQAADKSIGDRIEDLHRTHNQQRQAVITAELLDIIGGFEAASQRPDDDRIEVGDG